MRFHPHACALVAAYRDPDRRAGKAALAKTIDATGKGVPVALREMITLGCTPTRRARDVLSDDPRPTTHSGRPRPTVFWAALKSQPIRAPPGSRFHHVRNRIAVRIEPQSI